MYTLTLRASSDGKEKKDYSITQISLLLQFDVNKIESLFSRKLIILVSERNF